ncbi:DUF1559 domain-containing protein [Fuerstiella marisgermanici]|uniref:DUF1559 domain-containing protein n=1 Tax=Fuerstiella marisgermanici TaxID=1891926 RepID=A0A1P8WP19_9PLAN|nr:DUF1559 domain-containing protein [Fuerstiella marisgermanici]APZ95804.1 hypothetical protein Fuma_05466 [Fuerstiella marisgermanici]
MHPFPPNRTELPTIPWPAIIGFSVAALLMAGVVLMSLRQRPPSNSKAYRWWLVMTAVMSLGLLVGFAIFASGKAPWVALYFGVCILFCLKGLFESENELPPGAARKELGKAFSYFCALITVGMALVLFFAPPIEQSRGQTRRVQCKNNLKQIGLAFYNFHDEYGRLPSAGGVLPDMPSSGPPVSWRVAILPFIDERPLFERYDTSAEWDSAANTPLQTEKLECYTCYSHPAPSNEDGAVFTPYVVPTGTGAIFGDPESVPVTLPQIQNTSQVLLVAEACGSRIIWTNPKDLDVR